MPFVVVVNEDKAVWWLRNNYPTLKILFRITGQDWGAGATKLNRLLPLFRSVPADYYSIGNEWLPDATPEMLADACAEYNEAMEVASDAGIHIVVGDLNTGHPNLAIPGMLDAMRPMLEAAQDGGHALNVHVYLQGGDQANDPGIWQRIAREYPALPILIGELGILENDGRMTPEGFASLLRYDDVLTEQVIGCGLYSLTDSTWPQCNYADQLDAYAAHVRSR